MGLTVEQQGLKFCAENNLLRRGSFGLWLIGESVALEWTQLRQSISKMVSVSPNSKANCRVQELKAS